MSKTISITKKELELILESLNGKKSFLVAPDIRIQEYSRLIRKLKELSPYYEHILQPIQYDEF
jgi:hypothetical protein